MHLPTTLLAVNKPEKEKEQPVTSVARQVIFQNSAERTTVQPFTTLHASIRPANLVVTSVRCELLSSLFCGGQETFGCCTAGHGLVGNTGDG